jgi:hypothetical protein
MLHGDRFKHISNAGRDALEAGGFLQNQTPGKAASKKKSRKRK